MKKLSFLSIIFASTFLSFVHAAPPEVATCVACHGPEGKSTNPIYPHLAGQHAAYLKKQLIAFKAGTRKDPVMGAMAKPLSKKQIDVIAKYYSEL